MRNISLLAITIIAAIALTSCDGKKSNVEMADFNDSVSYAVGMDICKNIPKEDFNIDFISKAINDYATDTNSLLLTEEQYRDVLSKYQQVMMQKQLEEQARQQEENAKQYEGEKKAGEDFLAENAKRPEVKTTASGLQYEVIKQGKGKKPEATSTVKVHYEGKTIDGKVFDSSYERGEPAEFPLNRVISGWTEGLQLMTVGSKYKLYIPYNLGYGERGAGADIHPYSALIFTVELLEIK